MKIEIVSHCYAEKLPHYAQALQYQLSSLVLDPPRCEVTVTVCCYEEDLRTLQVFYHFFRGGRGPAMKRYEFTPAELGRRAIGRNIAAKQTEADIVWFADVDQCYRNGILDRLATMEWPTGEETVRLEALSQLVKALNDFLQSGWQSEGSGRRDDPHGGMDPDELLCEDVEPGGAIHNAVSRLQPLYGGKLPAPEARNSWRELQRVCRHETDPFKRQIDAHKYAGQLRDWVQSEIRPTAADPATHPPFMASMIYPKEIMIHRDHATGDACLARAEGICDVDPSEFVTKKYSRAIGGVQIVRGDFARKHGYLDGDLKWQRPTDGRFDACHCDRPYRRFCGEHGPIVGVDLPGLHRLRHTEAGHGRPASTGGAGFKEGK